MKWTFLLLLLVALTSYRGEYAYDDVYFGGTLAAATITAKQQVPEALNADWVLLARLVNAEAGNQARKFGEEGRQGQHAVADAVMHLAKEKGWSISRTIYDKNKYGPRYDGVRSSRFKQWPNDDCLEAARKAILGKHILPYGVFYFHNPNISTDTVWVSYIEKYAYKDFGEHRFCYAPKYYTN